MMYTSPASGPAHVVHLQLRIRSPQRTHEGLTSTQQRRDLAVDDLVTLRIAKARADGEGEVRVAGRVRNRDAEGLP
eukprot:scaffold27683_cov63-Phaeocystis_antarctica.AAC.1